MSASELIGDAIPLVLAIIYVVATFVVMELVVDRFLGGRR